MIYFAQRPDGKIKIGSSNKPKERLKSLQAEYGMVEIIAVMEGGVKQETLLHKHFVRINTGLDGREWFHPSAALLDYIEKNAKPLVTERIEIQPRLPKGRIMNARVPTTEATRDILRDFANGLETNYEDAILFLLSHFVNSGERPFLAGKRNYEKFTAYLCKFIADPEVPSFPKALKDDDTQPIVLPAQWKVQSPD